jgi:transcriptional regulator of NAD metabolism
VAREAFRSGAVVAMGRNLELDRSMQATNKNHLVRKEWDDGTSANVIQADVSHQMTVSSLFVHWHRVSGEWTGLLMSGNT